MSSMTFGGRQPFSRGVLNAGMTKKRAEVLVWVALGCVLTHLAGRRCSLPREL